jgi:DnaJ-domain-containing protein 1
MPGKNAFDDLKKSKEEEYFRTKERELIEKIRRRMEISSERKQLAGVLGIADEEIVKTLHELGYTRDTVRLLYLVPLVQVAWASGRVTPKERETVLDAGKLIGVNAGTDLHAELVEWLDNRPAQHFFDQTLRVIRSIMETLPAEERTAGADSLVDFCKNVAAASGGILGFGKISEDEKEVIERIAAELEKSHQDEARRIIAEGSKS